MPGSFFFSSSFFSFSLSLCSLSILCLRGSRSNCRERFARNALHRDAPGERTTDGVKKSVKRIRDAPNYIIDFASNTRASERAPIGSTFSFRLKSTTSQLTLPPPKLFSSCIHVRKTAVGSI